MSEKSDLNRISRNLYIIIMRLPTCQYENSDPPIGHSSTPPRAYPNRGILDRNKKFVKQKKNGKKKLKLTH